MNTFSIDNLPTPIRSPFLILSGKKDATVNVLEVNGDQTSAVFPTSTSWEYTFHLSGGVNEITLRSKDIAGNWSTAVVLHPELPDIAPTVDSIYNALDDKGLEVMVTRLPGEKNVYLKNRILDAESNLGNATYSGLMFALSRELSLDIVADVFTITPIQDSTSRELRATSTFLILEPTRLLIEAAEFYKAKEKMRVDSGSRQTSFSKLPTHKNDVSLQRLDGSFLEADDFDILDETTLRVYTRDELLLASYKYLEDVAISSTTTLSDLKTDIEALTAAASTQLFSVTISSGYDSSLATRLVRSTRSVLPRDGLSINLAQIQLTDLGNKIYRDSLLNQYGTFLGTKLDTYAEITRAKGRIFVKDTILDKDVLIDSDPNQDLATLPHIYDPVINYYQCSKPTDTTRYGRKDYLRNGACPVHTTAHLSVRGIDPIQLQSGPGNDLRMVKVV